MTGRVTPSSERSSVLNAMHTQVKLDKLARQGRTQVEAVVGHYNLSESIKLFVEYQAQLNKNPPKTIQGLYEQIENIQEKRNELGLEEKYSDAGIVEQQIHNYLVDALRRMPHNLERSPEKLPYYWDFDSEYCKTLPKTPQEELWEALLNNQRKERTARQAQYMTLILGEISQTAADIAPDRLIISQIPARQDEFVVELAKMRIELRELADLKDRLVELERKAVEPQQIEALRKELKQKYFAFQRLFIFNPLRENIFLTELSYNQRPQLVQDVKTGKIPFVRTLSRKLEEKVQNKYNALAQFFQQGGWMPQLLTDYAFDGEKFKAAGPFKTTNSGYIQAIDFSPGWLKITDQYDEEPPSSGCCRYRSKPRHPEIKSIKNMGAFFEAILEGDNSRDRLERVCLAENELTEEAFQSFCSLLKNTQIKHLDLSDTTVPGNLFSQLPAALEQCSHLEVVNFSNMNVREETFQPTCFCGTSKPIVVTSPISDEQTSYLLAALDASRETLLEVWCAGPGPMTPPSPPNQMPMAPIIVRGNAGSKSAANVLNIITFPHLVSYNFSYQKITTDVVTTAVTHLLNNTSTREALLHGIRSEELAEEPPCWSLCCKPRFVIIYDEPSAGLIEEMKKATERNRGGPVAKNLLLTVENMYKKYIASLTSVAQKVESDKERAAREAAEAIRHQEEMEHRKKVELAAAGASKMVINPGALLSSETDFSTLGLNPSRILALEEA